MGFFKEKELKYLPSILLVALLFTFPIVFSITNSGVTSLTTELIIDEIPLLQYLEGDEAVIYFGYVGCLDSCPKAFENLSVIHNSDSRIYFVNLIPGLTNQDVQDYLASWQETAASIKGIQATAKDLSNIEEYFGNFQAGRIGVYNPQMHTDQVFILEKNITTLNWEIVQRLASSAITSL